MKTTFWKRAGSLFMALVLTMGVCAFGLNAAAATMPTKAETKTGVTVFSNDKASVDASNLSEGYIMVKYTGGKNVRIKVQIAKSGGTTYTYDLNNKGTAETFPLTEGNGAYSVKIFENTTGSKYAQAYSTDLNMTLRSEFLPFLYSNQYVNYTSNSAAVAQAAKLTAGKSDVDKIQAVFDFVVQNVSYDYEKAKTVQSGYLPVIDTTLSTKKGICFDYAALMTAMLRSQNIPTKLIIGYSGKTYHAWINTYVNGVGWVDSVIYFDGQKWTLMDPTFVSSSKRSDTIMKYVTNPANYQQKYAY